ncbi:hypothetical protein JYU34_018655 [Plutella xylostella]|uniref:RecA family profile 1 domain-containing protein n=1 Tax=Plutella xylostella TaxID=51655 RepID=A0ABQ7PZI0_PLUXY|nr:hypothetical protein JYU34_018655 [Plutella xylostella]
MAPWSIRQLTNLNSEDIALLKNVAAESSSPVIVTGHRLLVMKNVLPKRVATGCMSVDGLLLGGFQRGCLTEVYGESGSGKTQVAIQAAVSNWPSGTVYICTEDLFPVKRFNQISKNNINYHPSHDYGKSVFVEHVTESQELLSCIRIRLPKLLESNNVSLVVIDSVAAPFRSETTNYIQRAEELREMAISLLKVAREFNLAVVCINQVTSSMEGTGDNVLPSLGLAWSNMVATRLWLRKSRSICLNQDNYHHEDMAQNMVQVRELYVAFAPDLPNEAAEFIITESGLKAIQ